jgi:hypothetical protein
MFSRVLKQVPSNSAINRGIWQDIRAAAGNRMRRRETADVPDEYWQQSMSILKAAGPATTWRPSFMTPLPAEIASAMRYSSTFFYHRVCMRE